MNKVAKYIKETKGELKHVSWPTQRQAVIYTIIVILVSLFIAAFLGAFDFLFTELLDRFVI